MRVKGWKAAIAKTACLLIHYLLVDVHIPRKTIIRRCRKVMTRFANIETQMVSSLTDTNSLEEAMSKEVLLPLQKVEFEGMQLSTVHDYDAYLGYSYGDYMQIPPVEKRKIHKPFKLQFAKEVEGVGIGD